MNGALQTSTNLWVWYFVGLLPRIEAKPFINNGALQSASIHPSPGRHLKKRATRELQDVAGYANLDGLGWKGSLERLQQSQKKCRYRLPSYRWFIVDRNLNHVGCPHALYCKSQISGKWFKIWQRKQIYQVEITNQLEGSLLVLSA